MSASAPRLSLRTLPLLAGRVAAPAYDPGGLRTGIVHLGIGAFHRAHQATFTELADDVAEQGWGIVAATQRSRAVVDQLRPQDGLFTVVSRDGGTAPQARVVGTVRQVLHAGSDGEALADALAAERTRLVTTTVTEKGYAADLATRSLDHGSALVSADLEDPRPHRSVVGQLVGGFARRADAGLPGISVLCCDNVQGGGDLLRTLCRQFLDRWSGGAAGEVGAWVDAHVTFPNTLVDRIVPATTGEDLDRYARLLGYRDEALVSAEPFGLWVVEDDFAAGHPRWPGQNVKLVDDIRPWSDVKLRLLNGSHSLLAYVGLLTGVQTVGDAVRRPLLSGLLDRFLDEAGRSLRDVPEGLDLVDYRSSMLERFANPGITHRLEQIAADGSLKIPTRVGALAADLARRGEAAPVSALAAAAWIRHVELRGGSAQGLADPAADRLTAAVAAGTDPRGLVEAVLGPAGVVPLDGSLHGTFLDDAARALAALRRDGVRALAELVA